ncbi:MAG: hypothetical protein ACK44W_01930 [Planctomycetota bacterium]
MPVAYRDGEELLTDAEAERIYRVIDSLGFDRDGFILPLKTASEGRIFPMPDGRVLLRAPGGEGFDAWLADLPARLREADLSRVPRRRNLGAKDELFHLGGSFSAGSRGSREAA